MCARFTVLSDTPIAAAIAGWAIPLSHNTTIWMRWRCAAGIFQRSAVLSRRTSALLHLAICLPRIRWRKRITAQGEETISSFRRLASKNTDSSRYGGGISCLGILILVEGCTRVCHAVKEAAMFLARCCSRRERRAQNWFECSILYRLLLLLGARFLR